MVSLPTATPKRSNHSEAGSRVGEKFLEWADKPLSMDQILDNVTLYWLTETFPRSIYPYRQFLAAPTEPNVLTYHISKPLGYSWFPREVVPIPKAWVSSVANLVWHRQHTEGGHFAAMEYPQVLLTDLEDFVAQVWK
jgi:microsomal epoxide hydrolase